MLVLLLMHIIVLVKTQTITKMNKNFVWNKFGIKHIMESNIPKKFLGFIFLRMLITK